MSRSQDNERMARALKAGKFAAQMDRMYKSVTENPFSERHWTMRFYWQSGYDSEAADREPAEGRKAVQAKQE
jgi:hypothetical protein